MYMKNTDGQRFDKKYMQDLYEWYYFDFRENSFPFLL